MRRMSVVWVDPGKSRKGSFCSGVGLLFGLGLLGEAPQFSQWPAEAPHQRHFFDTVLALDGEVQFRLGRVYELPQGS